MSMWVINLNPQKAVVIMEKKEDLNHEQKEAIQGQACPARCGAVLVICSRMLACIHSALLAAKDECFPSFVACII